MRMKFCTARQTSLYRKSWQCTDELEQLLGSCDNADASTHDGQHCAEVEGDGNAHVGGCAALTCLQRTDSTVGSHILPTVSEGSYAAYAGMQQGRALQVLSVEATARQVQGALHWQAPLFFHCMSLSRVGPITLATIQCQHKPQREAAAQHSCKE